MKLLILSNLLLALLLVSCSVKEKPIEYGSDKCDYCQMTIVDQEFGAEIVNNKGKAFKFDAAECLIRYIHDGEIKDEDIAMRLVTAINKPGQLMNAESSHYLISDNLPSPMGAFLSAYEDESTAKEYQSKYGGKVYSWDELVQEFKN